MASVATAPTADASPAAGPSADVVHAVRNGLKLGLSLLCTYGISLAIRFYVPERLGPELFGVFDWADATAALSLVAITFGVDTYVRREIPVRPEHASEFLGSLLALRLAGGLLLASAMALYLVLTDTPVITRNVAFIFAGIHLLIISNETFAALLHANGTVNGLSVINVISKLSWGVGAYLALRHDRYWVEGVALSFLTSEAIKGTFLFASVKNNLKVRLHFAWPAIREVLMESRPFFLAAVATVANGRLGVFVLGHLVDDRELGWYSAANNLALLTMTVTPLIGWVMQPLLARAAVRSEEELNGLMRRSMEFVLILTVPVTLAMGVGADVWISLTIKDAYSASTLPLQILALRFLLTYVAIYLSVCLITVRRSWTVTLTSAMGLILNPLLCLLLVPVCRSYFGAENGGAGAGCAVAMLFSEVVVVMVMVRAIGRRAFDRRSMGILARSLGVSVAVITLDHFLRWMGPQRILVDAVAYLILAATVGALPFRDVLQFVKAARAQRAAGPSAA